MADTEITITFDVNALHRYTDTHLAALWHVAQANPADGFASKEPGEIAEKIGREIISRWLRATPPELYRHQGHHHDWKTLSEHGKWAGGKWMPQAEYDAAHIAPPIASTTPLRSPHTGKVKSVAAD